MSTQLCVTANAFVYVRTVITKHRDLLLPKERPNNANIYATWRLC